MVIRCTFHPRNSPTRQCCQTATDFYQLIPGVEVDFTKGSESEMHGGYLARCGPHNLTKEQLEPMRANFMRIDRDTYIVGVVMES